MADESLIFSIEIPEGCLSITDAPQFTAAAPELTDAEVDALWEPRPVRATRPDYGEAMHEAIFGDSYAEVPGDARALGWPL